MPGTAFTSVSIHLPPISGSNVLNPVTLPPGFARLCTNPAPTGSTTTTKTMGVDLFRRCRALRPGVPLTTTTSGGSLATSLAYGGAIRVLGQPPHLDGGIFTI